MKAPAETSSGMVEISQPSPGSFLSNSDKHRGTRLPLTIDDDLCLETGIDLGDGTHIVFKPGMRHSSYIYSISQHYPDEWFGGSFVLYHLLSNVMELVLDSVGLHLEGTVSACI